MKKYFPYCAVAFIAAAFLFVVNKKMLPVNTPAASPATVGDKTIKLEATAQVRLPR